MMHQNRTHRVTTTRSVRDLAEKLLQDPWTVTTGFKWRSLTLLNDSTSPDAIQEYAVMKADKQIESLTVYTMTSDELVHELCELDASK